MKAIYKILVLFAAFTALYSNAHAQKNALLWATYLGGDTTFYASGVVTDASGNVYVAGQTLTDTGLATSGAYQTSGTYVYNIEGSAYLAKFTSAGKLLWGTYYGGSFGISLNSSYSISTDRAGNIYVNGYSYSDSGLATSGAYQTTGNSNGTAILAKFSPAGKLLWATYYGGDSATSPATVVIDTLGNLYMTGQTNSKTGIATSGAYQTSFLKGNDYSAFLAKFDTSGKLKWSTYYNANTPFAYMGLGIDAFGNVYISSATNSSTGVATSGAYQTSYGGNYDAFLAKFSFSGSLLWATYYGGPGYDDNGGLTIDKNNNVYLTGQTQSKTGIATAGAYMATTNGVNANAYITKFNSSGKLVWGTYYGGDNGDQGDYISSDTLNNIYITGLTYSPSGIATSGAYQTTCDTSNGDAFLTKFNSAGNLLWGTFYGGVGTTYGNVIQIDNADNIYLNGGTLSTSGIATSGAYQTSINPSTWINAFLAKFGIPTNYNDAGISSIIAPTASFCGGTQPVKVKLKNYGTNALEAVKILGSVNSNILINYTWTGNLAKGDSATVTIGKCNFKPGEDTLKVWTEPIGFTDTVPGNDTATIFDTVKGLPQATTGGNKSFCPGGSANIGGSAVSGDTYSWVSVPTGFTSTNANTSVAPTTTTTYILTETITSTGCSKSDSAIITVNPFPAANAGTSKAICDGDSATIGSTAVSGDAYSWVSNPSGYTSTSSKLTIRPTATTTYYLTETTKAGCSKTDSVIITVNPLPSINAGKDTSFCKGSSRTIGTAAISGDTYSWTGSPSGFTSTSANPSVSPNMTTIYYLTETIIATGCSSSDSVIITVHPLPAANTGASHSICTGNSTTIGAAPVSGDRYTWAANPSGFTSTTANPSVSPTITTTYTLTETITATGCSKSDSVIITVNPLPNVNAGSASTVCAGNSATIGATGISGVTYSWAASPTGFASTSANPSVSPTITTTYTLTGTITATGCKNSDSVIITVKPLPLANAGASKAICYGDSASIGASAVPGDSYNWVSNPAGFTSTRAGASPAPTVTTTFILTETITATGCSKSDSVIVTVNPLPLVNANSNSSICNGNSVIIGTPSVSGNTYSWTSMPLGFTSTSANPKVSPTITTTYSLTETITATGCINKDSVTITVYPLPNAFFTDKEFGDSISFTPKSSNDSIYSWNFGDSSFSNLVNPIHAYSNNGTYTVSLTVMDKNGCTATYKIADTVNRTGIANVSQEITGLRISPNPFSSSFTVEYNLLNNSHIIISIYDMTGKELAWLLDENQNEGRQSYSFDTEKYNITTGVYLLKILIAKEIITNRIIKIK